MSSYTSDDSPKLDFLRAYAVLAVYAGHLLQTFGIERIFGPVTIYDIAQTGVLIFFVHTSLVLMLSLERFQAVERLPTNTKRLFATFYIRRAFRIYPLSVATILLTVAAHIPPFPTESYSWPGWAKLISNLALTQNLTRSGSILAVLWSLPWEVQMYVVLPFIFIFLQRFRARWVPIVLWLAAVSLIVLLGTLSLNPLRLLLQYTPCFLGGIIGYRLWGADATRLPFWGWPLTITLCVGLRVFAEASGLKGAQTVSPWLACLLLGLAVSQFRELEVGWLQRAAAAVAKYSYGVYLSHSIVFWIAFVLLRSSPFWVQGVICAVLSVILPVAMYWAIEKPLIGVGVRASQWGRPEAVNPRGEGIFDDQVKVQRWGVRGYPPR